MEKYILTHCKYTQSLKRIINDWTQNTGPCYFSYNYYWLEMTEVGGIWQWMSGSQVATWTNWASPPPGNDKCAVASITSHQWMEVNCNAFNTDGGALVLCHIKGTHI